VDEISPQSAPYLSENRQAIQAITSAVSPSSRLRTPGTRFATSKAKWDGEYRAKWGIRNGPAAPLPAEIERRMPGFARQVISLLKIKGAARLDLRLTPAGELVFIEANPNPSLARGDDFARSAATAGMNYETLIQRILDLARMR
jgi:D-alanine-D-alanine ligase